MRPLLQLLTLLPVVCLERALREPNALVVVPCRDSGGSGTMELQQLIDRGALVRTSVYYIRKLM